MIILKKFRWQPYIAFVLFTEAVGALAGILTHNSMEAYDALTKPPLTPPGIVFPIVWGVLFLLMGIGAARIYLSDKPGWKQALIIFGAQLAVNFLWSLLFFNLQARGFSFIWLIGLWILIILMIVSFWKIDRPAALLQIPYLLWVTFAGYLNCAIWILNK